MAATSYSTLPSTTYVGLRSQGDPYQSSTYGTYDSGIGSLTSHPYQYQPTTYSNNLTDSHQQSIYSNDYHQSTYSNNDHSTQQHLNIPTNKYPQQSTNQQQKHSNDHSNSQTPKTDDRSIATDNHTGGYAATRTTQPPHKKNTDHQHADPKHHQNVDPKHHQHVDPKHHKNVDPKHHQHVDPKHHQQTSNAGTTQRRPSVPVDNEHHQSQSNLVRSEHQISNQPPKRKQQHKSQPPLQPKLSRSEQQISKVRETPPPIRHRSSSIDNNNQASENAPKKTNPPAGLKPTKSSIMRAAANKKKEETREKKRKDQFFPSDPNKTTPPKSKSQQASPQSDVELSDFEKTKQNKKQSKSLTKTIPTAHTDGEQSDTGKKTRNKKQSHSQPVHRKSRRDNYQTEDNNSSGDDDDSKSKKHHRSKSKKRTTFSDTHVDKHPHLPPLRHGRIPPHHDPYLEYPFPPGHPLRGRFPPYDDYPPFAPYHGRHSHRHLYEDADDIPPYLPPYHDPYDAFFDYEKRKTKPKVRKDKTDPHTDHEDNNDHANGHETERDDGAKSHQSRKSRNKSRNNEHGGRKSHRDYEGRAHEHWPPGYYHPDYYDRENTLELWRQERNDYLKKKFKPTIHDVLYSQQWMKSDSYLENQRRRTLRDVQGYYFPYKKYTLKDYKDLQKVDTQNPFADVNETTIDRKERARKRQEYGALVERHIADNPGSRQVPHRDIPPRKPWHLSGGEPQDVDKSSKRERALEYAKVQVKYRPVDSTKNSFHKSDPSEHYGNNQYPDMNDDDNGRTSKTNQSYDEYD